MIDFVGIIASSAFARPAGQDFFAVNHDASDVVLPRDLMELLAVQGPHTMPQLGELLADSPWRMTRFGPQILQILKG